ncbi:NADP-dependent 3-hydroxy acid dehydrogenase YdfG [Kribbella orskensis]|uniref:NADP-dependent 3-hydroxy acid dehydrogenase YdfG n=1 Tax=Kribbella orskensis TaxID=2512216 RepID=A0ABY2BNS0_9ACTN|nr:MULTISPECIES: SDR family NAD(P)-dependent oxidoreductase [Kribbella]TCN41906.1 NADP-dependent 3-hydroxy acid dehydrogenase YdfG [Kribbella sp. VKM Ac-2500]TCO25784.1 NADP-dependent 3-hydroxy acid dehydrogenase YdfG [Kribbella orskensis]
MARNVFISGASSGFGLMTSRALADAGHTVFAGIRDIGGRNAEQAAAATEYAKDTGADLRVVELDVTSEESVRRAADDVLSETGRLDVVVHNVGHMVVGPAEAFTAEQLAELYDTNVLGAHRLNRALLPTLRIQGEGLLVWIGSTSTRGGTPPYLAPYFAAKAALDALAATTALEVARFGIETTIVVPGSFTHGTNHYAHAGRPADADIAAEYEARYPQLMEEIGTRMAALEPADADPSRIARIVAGVVGTPAGRRPFRVHYDPSDDGAVVVNAVADRIRAEFLTRLGLADLLHPTTPKGH